MTFDIHIQIDDHSPEATENYDHIFMPELIAKLDAARAEARTGNNLTMEQVKENLKV